MEGKLSEARDSLMPSPPPPKHESPFSISIGEFAAGRGLTRSVSQATGEKRIFYANGQSETKRQQNASNAAHLRQSLPVYDGNVGLRSVSALGATTGTSGFGSPDSLLDDHTFGEGRIHVRRASTTQRNYVPLGSLRENEPGSSLLDKQTAGLGISEFTPIPGVFRSKSQSQMRDLRDQMNDLKGKIWTLKARAKEDNIRRRSLQSLRTPSPFTSAAEQWYTSAIEYREGGLNTNAGYGWSPKKEFADSPVDEHHEESKTSGSPADMIGVAHDSIEVKPTATDAMSTVETPYEDGEEGPLDGEEVEEEGEQVDREPQGEDEMLEDELDDGDLMDDNEEGEEEHLDADPYEEGETDDEFLDTESAPAERHEDRADAFDYEHFFLHSALGNYSRTSRRSRRGSVSSEESVETTRALTPSAEPGSTTAWAELKSKRSFTSIKSATLRPPRVHHRNDSVDSVSTFATFATATEGLDNDDEGDGSDEAVFWQIQNAQHAVPAVPIPNDANASVTNETASWPPRNSSRSGSRPNSRANSIYITRPARPMTVIQINGYPTPTIPKDSLTSSEPTNSMSITTAKGLPMTPSPQPTSNLVQALMAADAQRTLNFSQVDRELVEKLVESLGKVCVQMGNSAGEEAYESKVWRRRLDTARRVLEGEVDLDQEVQTA
jgi:hypothetical protein